MNKRRKRNRYTIETTEALLTLMSIYLEEWKHRDAMLWKQVFTYFFAILIVMVVPFANINGFNLGDNLPKWFFPCIGIVLDVIYAIICYNYSVRLSAVGDIYSNLIKMLPKKYRRIKLKGKPFIFRMSYFLAIVFPICLLFLGVLLIHIAI